MCPFSAITIELAKEIIDEAADTAVKSTFIPPGAVCVDDTSGCCYVEFFAVDPDGLLEKRE